MANPYIWNALQRANNDPTTIDEAIGEAITAHNDDVDAHLGDDQSLQSHRASEIIDHLAESVVNDKLRGNARAWIAIVDPESESDFDTLPAAVAYAQSKGGGVILIMPGEYYLTEDLYIPPSCNLQGIDAESVIIHCGTSGGGRIIITNASASEPRTINITGLTFSITGIQGVFIGGGEESYAPIVSITDCSFSGGGQQIYGFAYRLYLDRCIFYATAAYNIFCGGEIYIANSVVQTSISTGVRYMIGTDTDYYDGGIVRLTNCNFLCSSTTTYGVFNIGTLNRLYAVDCDFYNAHLNLGTNNMCSITNSSISLYTSGYINISRSYSIFSNNYITGGTGNRLRLATGSTRNIVTGNIVPTAITNSGTNNIVASNIMT